MEVEIRMGYDDEFDEDDFEDEDDFDEDTSDDW